MEKNLPNVIEDNKNVIKSTLDANGINVYANFTKATLCVLETFFNTEDVTTIVSNAVSDYKNGNYELDMDTREKTYGVLNEHDMRSFVDDEHTELSSDRYSFRLSKISRCLINAIKDRDNFIEIMNEICNAWCFNNFMHGLLGAISQRNTAHSSDNNNGGNNIA